MYEAKITLDVSPRLEDALLRLADGLVGTHIEPPAPVPENTPTADQVCRASVKLFTADLVTMQDVRALLARYGVNAVADLKPEQLRPFAADVLCLAAQ